MIEHSAQSTEITRFLEAAGPAMVRGIEASKANSIVDEIRNSLGQNAGWFDLWAAIDNKIGSAQPDLQKGLVEFRSWFENELFAASVRRIENAFAQNTDDGWHEWLQLLAEAVSNFRLIFSARLFEPAFPFRETEREHVEQLRSCVNYMSRGQWMESYKYLNYLGKYEWLPAPVRGRILSMLGQIQSIHFAADPAAKRFFDAAEKLAPDDGSVLSAIGQFWQKTPEGISRAEEYYNRGIKLAPHIPNAYCDLGDLYNSRGLPEKAKSFYERAVKACPGYSLGYGKLMSFLGRPQNFEAHESELLPLLKTGIIVSPEDEYQFYVDYGNIYLQTLQFDKAREIYQKAIDLDPSRPYALVFMAQSYEKQDRFKDAKEIYRHLTVVAPDSYEGGFGLALLAQQKKEWVEALEWYQKIPRTVDELAGTFDARAGEMYARLGDYAKAEEIATRVLRSDKGNEAAKSVLTMIAGDYYRDQNNRAEAIRIYDQMLEIVGPTYAGDYHNLLGNLSYYFREYQQAADEYRLAVEAANSSVFHRNLALACRNLKRYEEAASELEKAFALDDDSRAYLDERSLLLNAEGNDFYAQGNYPIAIELYTKALSFNQSDDVIHSNLAGAWENLKEPGRAHEAIGNAITSYQNAKSINPTEKYTLAIDRLSAKKAFLELYGESANTWLPVVTPIAVEVAADLIPFVEGKDGNSLSEAMTLRLSEMRARIKASYGVALPGVRFRGNEVDFAVGMYVFLLGEIPIVSGNCKKAGRYFPGSKATLTAAGVDGEEQANPVTRETGFWISEEDAKTVEAAGHELWDSADFIMRHLESVLQRNLTDFLGHQEVFELVRTERPEAEKELRTDRDKLTALTIVCHALLAEGVSISPFTEVYDQFAKLHAIKATPQSIVESIRSLPGVRPHLPGNDPRFSLFALSPQFESSLKNTVYQSKTCSLMAIKPEDCQEVLAAIRNAVSIDRNLIVVHDPDLRPLVRLLLEIEFPEIPVLSERELLTDHEFKGAQVLDLEDSIENSESPLLREASAGAETVETVISDSSKVDPQVTVQVNQAFLENRSAADTQDLEQILSLMRDGLFYELGVMIPEVKVTTNNALQPHQFRFRINGIESNIIDGLEFNQFLVNDTVSRLSLVGVTGKDRLNPANSNQAAVVENENDALQLCTSSGLITWGPKGYLVLALSAEVRKRAASFQTTTITKFMVELLRPSFPDLFDTVLKRFTLDQLTLLFKNLLDEGISIRDLRAIMEALLSVRGTTGVDMSRYIVFLPQGQNLYPVAGDPGRAALTMENYTDAVRMSLKKYISYKYTRGSSTLMVYLMDPQSEKRFADTSRPLSDEEKVSFMDAVEMEVGSRTAISESATILTSMEVRRAIRNALKERFFNVAVISYQELSPETSIQPLARISWIPEEETSSEAVAS